MSSFPKLPNHDKLNSSNYATWRSNTIATARFMNLWCILDGKESTPDKAKDLAAYNNYQLRKDQAIALLELTVENEQRIHFTAELSKEQPSVIWTALENAHRQKKPAQHFNTYEKLFSI